MEVPIRDYTIQEMLAFLKVGIDTAGEAIEGRRNPVSAIGIGVNMEEVVIIKVPFNGRNAKSQGCHKH